jgi:hypothetical protein
MSLCRAPNPELIKSTSNKLDSPITSILNDDVLLNIFYIHRLHLGLEDEEGCGDALFIRRWDRQRWWYKLAQVSQQWRRVILESPSLLDLHLVCTYGVPVADMLAHSPPLPLIIFYQDGDREMTIEDEEGALLAISPLYRDRVRRIALEMPAQAHRNFITAMGRFPILEHLYIECQSEDDASWTVPLIFAAPNLRHIHLGHVTFSIESTILTGTTNSPVGLVDLWLGGIPQFSYFSPSYILTRLSLIPQLQTLGIGFHSPPAWLEIVFIVRHVTLPNLRVFSFLGVSDYLECLVSQINAPALTTLDVRFFDAYTLSIPHLLQMVQASENLVFNTFELSFSEGNFVDLVADSHRRRWKRPLSLRIMCKPRELQVASAVSILSALSPVLSVVEKLTLNQTGHDLSSGSIHVNRSQWRELLRIFNGVKTLYVNNQLVGALSRSLPSEDGEPPLGLLPNLEELSYSGSDVDDAFLPFINERQATGHPVRLSLPPQLSN